MVGATKKKKKKNTKLSSEEKKARKIKSDHKSLVRSVFRFTGFKDFAKLRDKEFSIDSSTSDFDDVFVFENIVILTEYTVSKDVSSHLKPKKIIYDKIEKDPEKMLKVLADLDQEFSEYLAEKYTIDEFIVRVVYCSLNSFDDKYKAQVPSPIYLDYPELKYFRSTTETIRHSARAELLEFLKIDQSKVGCDGKIGVGMPTETYKGSLLPEKSSNFPPGYKVVSLYIDPEALLLRSYVLRKQGWRDTDTVYQRMLSPSKIKSIRKYLKDKKRVFVNNVIATLDKDTKIVGADGNTVDPTQLTSTEPVKIQLPSRLNTVGIIDGQHRTFSYFQSDPDDIEIAKLRARQNLLLTGVIFPANTTSAERERFEAELFLEINSTQTNAKSDLKQEINLILKPFADESIARKVLNKLDRSGALAGEVERYWFDKDKLKTTSVVSYGLKPLVKTTGEDSLFELWSHPDKATMVSSGNSSLLKEYVDFCANQINEFLSAVQQILPNDVWTPDRRVKGRLITTTTVNSLLILLRLLIDADLASGRSYYLKQMASISTTDFQGYHSSQYARMAKDLFDKYFG